MRCSDSPAGRYDAAMTETTATPAAHDLPAAGVHAARVAGPQTRLAEGTFLLRLRCEAVAAAIRPGQFVMFRDEENADPLLGRPFALYDVDPDEPGCFTIAYHVIGKQTRLMVDWESDRPLRLWGPLGNGFPADPLARPHESPAEAGAVGDDERLLFVGGGIGYSPFPAVARQSLGLRSYGDHSLQRRFTSAHLVQGARTAALMTREEPTAEEAAAGMAISRCTDDGSLGHHGLVTDLFEEHLNGDSRPGAVFTCGPVPMMRAVAERCLAAGVPCWLSLETPMACGYGACFSCVVPVRDDTAAGGWDYRRSCVEGPVFEAAQLDLAAM